MSDMTGPRVRMVISEHLDADPSRLTDAASLKDLGADMLDIVEIAIALDEEFGTDLIGGDLDKLVTVGNAIDLVTRALVAAL